MFTVCLYFVYLHDFIYSCLTTVPHFKKATETASVRKPLLEYNPAAVSEAGELHVAKPGATPVIENHFAVKIQGPLQYVHVHVLC